MVTNSYSLEDDSYSFGVLEKVSAITLHLQCVLTPAFLRKEEIKTYGGNNG